MAKVVLNNINKYYGDVHAVRDVSFEIQDKEFVVLVGPSGCGKSTTLRMIAGLEEISEGEIYIDNTLVNHIPPKNRNIAMVFQNYALYPHMTVFNNMAFGLKLRKFSKKEILNRVHEAADVLGIKNLLHRKPKELSGGQRQRVAVGRAIVRKPKVFLFDEPLSNLDPKLRVEMRSELNKLHTRLHTTMIYVTHDQCEAMTMGDRIVVMKDGEIQQIDSPIPLYSNPANKFTASFIGTPPMNFIKGKLIKENESLYFKEENIFIKIIDKMYSRLKDYAGKEIIFGVRPEDIYDKFFADPSETNSLIKGKIEIIEPIGSEIYLYIKAGKNSIIARVGANSKVEINQEIDFILDMDKIHFFDPITENLII
jgi:multiple sugar transport system ATP-binding protein